MTFSAREKLGLTFATSSEKVIHLTEMGKLGTSYEAMVKSEHWPVFAALLDSKAAQAIQKLRKPRLTEQERVESNVRANLIDEIRREIQHEINRAHLAMAELNKIKEN